MKSWHRGIKPWLIKYFALPSDVILELPRITIIGQIHVYIENHQGLATYTDSELKLKTNKGYIQITGSSFVLKMMLPKEILLEGTIKDIQFLPDSH
ncbi:sporulation protein YqfC [Virgibacillus halotolerans]|uniref:sporulation protein YqfC n=1 Tax=Virgibacillus halotolerans TaxID=1071053 RepID=UPI0019606A6E|nr:sporulation protein YqfC [Virgibacillus halotolerans]